MSDLDYHSVRFNREFLIRFNCEERRWYVVSNDGVERFDTFEEANLYAEALGYDE